MTKAVIFDMDGVIVDSEPMHKQVSMEILKSFGVDVEQRDIEAFAGAPEKYIWSTLKNRHNLSLEADELVSMKMTRYFEKLCANTEMKPIEGILELFEDLRNNNLKLAIASTSPMNVIERVVSVFNIAKYFDTIVTGDYVEKGKPEPDIFLYTAKKLGVNPDECVVIEDSGNGVKAAKKAGMKCIGFRNPNSGNQDLTLADKVIESFSESTCSEISRL